MPVQLVLGVNFICAAGLLAAAVRTRRQGLGSRSAAALALLLFLDGALLAAYVFGEDSYRDNGISRWEAYRSPGGALGPMFVISLVALALCAIVLIYATRRTKPGLLRTTAACGGITCLVLVTVTVAGFSLN